MPNINITVKNKIATGDGTVIICGNKDYTVNFTFDSEWDSYSAKTARFVTDDGYQEVAFNGNSCTAPAINNSLGVKIGVYAGDLHTTTPAYFDTLKSILCGSGTHITPPIDVYNQIMALLGQKANSNQGQANAGKFWRVGADGSLVLNEGSSSGVSSVNGKTGVVNLNANDVGALPNTTPIPSKTSDLTNDSGFLTEHQSLAAYRTASQQDVIDLTKASASSVSAIEGKIPAQATAQNQLADKAFVNSSIATNTAIFRGTFNSVAELEAYSGEKTNNDYAFVIATDAVGNTIYNRYKWNGTSWVFEYALNNSSFTAAQWAAIQSGITASHVTKLNGIEEGADVTPTNISAFTNDVGYLTQHQDISGKQDKPIAETYTIATADWTALASSEPYKFQATVTATHTIGADTICRLINNQAVLFGTYGFAIGSVSGQSVVIYAIAQPNASVSLEVDYIG